MGWKMLYLYALDWIFKLCFLNGTINNISNLGKIHKLFVRLLCWLSENELEIKSTGFLPALSNE